jgi:hypothetical protein
VNLLMNAYTTLLLISGGASFRTSCGSDQTQALLSEENMLMYSIRVLICTSDIESDDSERCVVRGRVTIAAIT